MILYVLIKNIHTYINLNLNIMNKISLTINLEVKHYFVNCTHQHYYFLFILILKNHNYFIIILTLQYPNYHINYNKLSLGLWYLKYFSKE